MNGRQYNKAEAVEAVISRVAAASAAGKPVGTVFADLTLPAQSTFYEWMVADANLRGRFDLARGRTKTQRGNVQGA